MSHLVSISDFREAARRRLPRLLFDYVDGGALTESALARSTADFQAIGLRQRVLSGVGKVELGVELFGQALSMPVVLGPVGLTGMYWTRGEVKAAKAARAAGVTSCLSNFSICSLEEVSAAVGAVWFQLYMLKDRGLVEAVLERAWMLGTRVLVFTVDVPAPGERLREQRVGLRGRLSAADTLMINLEAATHLHWLLTVYLGGRPHRFGNVEAHVQGAGRFGDFWNWVGEAIDANLTYEHLEWLRARWPGQIVLKGVLDVEDARLAVEAGMDGIVVSNHGGRQLDSAASSISALPAIVEAVGDRATVLLDGGVRSGEDVVKALALGAKACLLGRAWAYPLAAQGERGVRRALELFRQQMETTLVLTGCPGVQAVGEQLLA